MDNSNTGIVLTIVDRFGVSFLLVLAVIVGIWKASPKVSVFFAALIDEFRKMTGAVVELSTQTREAKTEIVAEVRGIRGELHAAEARIKEHGRELAAVTARDTRDVAEETGQRAALTVLQAELTSRQPSSPEMPAYRDDRITADRMTPTPSGQFTRLPALPPPPRSTRGQQEREPQDTPTSWRQVK